MRSTVVSIVLVLVAFVAGCVLTGEDQAPTIDPKVLAAVLHEVDAVIDQRLELGEALTRPELQALVSDVIERQLAGTPYEGQGYGELAAAIMEIVGGRLVKDD